MSKPIATLSIDLDDLWSYMRTAGLPGWQEYPSYLDVAIPRIRQTLERNDVKLTVFVVGRDAAKPENRAALAGLARDGHEIGNHSFAHDSWLSRRPVDIIASDIARADEAIAEAVGSRPVGFRGPSFGLSTNLIEVLVERGYLYDASTFPTFVGPLARAYYNLKSAGTTAERDDRKLLFGSLADGFRPLTPYAWEVADGGRLVEMPVTTFPVVRAPIHLTYLVFLAGISPALAKAYVAAALTACRIAGVAPSLLLHPLEFLDAEEAPALRFFPGMQVPVSVKLDLIDFVLKHLTKRFRVLPMRSHASLVGAHKSLSVRRPLFDSDGATLAPLTT